MKGQAGQCDWVEKKCAYADKAKVCSWQLDSGDAVRSGDGWETTWWRPEDYDKIFGWDDSGALESFQFARDRHEAKLRNLEPIPLPSPDLYIQQVIWNGEGGGGSRDLPESADSLSPPKEANKTWQKKRGQYSVTRNAGYLNYAQSSSVAASSHWKSGEMEGGGIGWFDNPPPSRIPEISDNRDGATNEGWGHQAREGGPCVSNEGCANQGRDGGWSVSNEGCGHQSRDGAPLVPNEGLGKQSREVAPWVPNDGWGNQAGEVAHWASNEGWGNQGIDGRAPLLSNEGRGKQGRDRGLLVSNARWGKQGIDGAPLVSNEGWCPQGRDRAPLVSNNGWGNQGIDEAPLVSEGWSPQGGDRVPLVSDDGWGNQAGDRAPWVKNKGWGNQGIDGRAPLVSNEEWRNQDRDRALLISNEGWGNQGRERQGNQGRERWGHQGRERVPLVSSERLGNQGGERWGNRGRERTPLVSSERWGNQGRERAPFVSNEGWGEEGRNGASWPDWTTTMGRGFSRYRGNPAGPGSGALPRPPLTTYRNDGDQRNQSSASPSCPNSDQMIGQGVSDCRSGDMNNTNQMGSHGQYHPQMRDTAAGHGRRNWRKYRKAIYN